MGKYTKTYILSTMSSLDKIKGHIHYLENLKRTHKIEGLKKLWREKLNKEKKRLSFKNN